MKKMNRYMFMMLAIGGALIACQPEKIKDYEPVTAGSVESVAGVWTGTSVLQRDNDAERKNFPYKAMDITSALEFNKVKLTLQHNAGQPTSFSVDHGGAPQIFRFTSGTWVVDDATKVGTIALVNAGDTIRLTLGSYNLISNNRLLLKQVKTLLGKEVITYEFNFSK